MRRPDEWTEAEAALDALARIGGAAVPEAVAMLDDPDPVVRRRGAEILARVGPDAEGTVEPLIRVMQQDADPAVRKAATLALGQLGPKAAAAVPALTRVVREASK
jgi:HEAT repeat protein